MDEFIAYFLASAHPTYQVSHIEYVTTNNVRYCQILKSATYGYESKPSFP